MITDDFAEFQGYRIWYRVAESFTSDCAPPILLLHGGPGLGSDYLEPLETLAEQGRTVIRFDQLGCGRSDRPRDLSLWTIQSCIKQIESIREKLKLDRIHLLGHSWGGMVALEYLLTHPSGVRSACLCSSVVSVPLWVEEALRLRSLMPSYISKALGLYEKSYHKPKPPEHGTKPARSRTQFEIDLRAWGMSIVYPIISRPLAVRFASWWMSNVPLLRAVAYDILSIQFYRKHVCRLQSMPFGIFRMMAGMNKEIYKILMGPSEFFCPGLYKDWDIRPRLSHIRLPTLILSGRHDEATPAQMTILKEGITNSEQVLLEQSSHCGMWEEPEKFREAILGFVNRVEIEAVNR
jgi:pimeloyl-ACP methyl ester carboxylesterase